MPALRQLGPQQREVLDDPVVHDRDPARVVEMRVGIGVGRTAVRGPTGVPDTGRTARQRPLDQLLLQIDQLPRLLRGGKTAVRQHGDAPRVVPPVFEPFQPGHHDIERRLRPHVSHDSAHVPQPMGRRRHESRRRVPEIGNSHCRTTASDEWAHALTWGRNSAIFVHGIHTTNPPASAGSTQNPLERRGTRGLEPQATEQ
jgi:hypothetical protein